MPSPSPGFLVALLIIMVPYLLIGSEFIERRKACINGVPRSLMHNLYIVYNSLRLSLFQTEAPVNGLALHTKANVRVHAKEMGKLRTQTGGRNDGAV
jgi:hypothetical protein